MYTHIYAPAGQCPHRDCGGSDSGGVSGFQCIMCGHYHPRTRVTIGPDSEPYCRDGMGCQSTRTQRQIKLAAHHNLTDHTACQICSGQPEIWIGYLAGRAVAHFRSRAAGDQAMERRLVESTSPIRR